MKIKALLEMIIALTVIVLITLSLTMTSTTVNSNTVAAEPDHSKCSQVVMAPCGSAIMAPDSTSSTRLAASLPTTGTTQMILSSGNRK